MKWNSNLSEMPIKKPVVCWKVNSQNGKSEWGRFIFDSEKMRDGAVKTYGITDWMEIDSPST